MFERGMWTSGSRCSRCCCCYVTTVKASAELLRLVSCWSDVGRAAARAIAAPQAAEAADTALSYHHETLQLPHLGGGRVSDV